MVMQWCDGFSKYGADADLALAYTVTNTPTLQAAGGYGGVEGAVRCAQGASASSARRAVSQTVATGVQFHAAFWFKRSAVSGSNEDICRFGSNLNAASSTVAPRFMSLSDGSIAYGIGNSSTLAGTSVTGVLTGATWTHIECLVKFHSSSGVAKLWVNGNLVVNYSGATANSAETSWNGFFMGCRVNGALTQDYSHLILWDETGTDFALTQLTTSYLPVIRTDTPTGDDSVQFTPLSSTNVSNIDDAAFHDGDTSYNSSSTVGHKDTFTKANQASVPLYTFAVCVKSVVKLDIAGSATAKNLVKIGSTNYESNESLTLTTTYALLSGFWGKDPSTVAVWGTSQIDSTNIGYTYKS